MSLDLKSREKANRDRGIQAHRYLCVSGAALQPGQQYYGVARPMTTIPNVAAGRTLRQSSAQFVLCSQPPHAVGVLIGGVAETNYVAGVYEIYFNDSMIQVDTEAAAPQPTTPETGICGNAVLEMRPANRSLRQKAQEELSEFERQYPW